MHIPQKVRTEIVMRKSYSDWIKREASIIAYLDLTNMFHWQNKLGWKFRIEDIVEQLFSFPNIKYVKVYYGFNGNDEVNSRAFHNRIRKTGAILRSKSMKFIKKSINKNMFFQRRTMTLFDEDSQIKNKISELVDVLDKSGMVIMEPKCNFDVEMAMDMIDDTEKVTAILLFSGDSDMKEPLERLKVKGKKVSIVGVRNQVARELHEIKDIYMDFGQFYSGTKTYIKSENPAIGGTA